MKDKTAANDFAYVKPAQKTVWDNNILYTRLVTELQYILWLDYFWALLQRVKKISTIPTYTIDFCNDKTYMLCSLDRCFNIPASISFNWKQDI